MCWCLFQIFIKMFCDLNLWDSCNCKGHLFQCCVFLKRLYITVHIVARIHYIVINTPFTLTHLILNLFSFWIWIFEIMIKHNMINSCVVRNLMLKVLPKFEISILYFFLLWDYLSYCLKLYRDYFEVKKRKICFQMCLWDYFG